MRLRRRCLASACALVVVLGCARAHAAELRWRGASECARQANVAEQVERLIGRPLADVSAVDFEVDVRRAADSSWQIAVQTVLPPGAIPPRARELRGGTCEEVADAAALAIAMVVQERAAEQDEASVSHAEPARAAGRESVPRSVARAQPDPAAAAATAGAAQAPPSAPSAERVVRFAVGAGVVFDLGTLPSLAPGAQLEFGIAYAALRASVFGALYAPQTADAPGQDRGGEFRLVLGGVRACAAPAFGAVVVMGCTGLELGQLSGEGRNVRRPFTQHAGFLAVLSELGAAWEFARGFAGLLRVGAAWPLSRPEFVLDGTTEVHRPAGLSLRVLIGLEVYL